MQVAPAVGAHALFGMVVMTVYPRAGRSRGCRPGATGLSAILFALNACVQHRREISGVAVGAVVNQRFRCKFSSHGLSPLCSGCLSSWTSRHVWVSFKVDAIVGDVDDEIDNVTAFPNGNRDSDIAFRLVCRFVETTD